MKNYRNSRRAGFKLEEFIAGKLKEIDKDCRPTRNSGASKEIGDIYSNILYCEAKEKHTKENIIIEYKKEYLKLLNQIPLNTTKFIIMVTENKYNEKFVTMDFDTFYTLLKRSYYDQKK